MSGKPTRREMAEQIEALRAEVETLRTQVQVLQGLLPIHRAPWQPSTTWPWPQKIWVSDWPYGGNVSYTATTPPGLKIITTSGVTS